MGLVLSFQVFQSVLSGTISSPIITVVHKQLGTPKVHVSPQNFMCLN